MPSLPTHVFISVWGACYKEPFDSCVLYIIIKYFQQLWIFELAMFNNSISTCMSVVWCLCNQCIKPPTLSVRIPFKRGVLYTLYDKACQWLAASRWFSLVSFTNKTDSHDITEILLKVALNTPPPHTHTHTHTIGRQKIFCVINSFYRLKCRCLQNVHTYVEDI